ncbi:MAG TPA: hypothetical protein VN426_04960 [Syntrophomonadaceae bacterium]|nr:hypothetical protein [Syntrophomonadaceae bacterium]
MQDRDPNTKKKTLTYFFSLFVMFSGASLFVLAAEPDQKLWALRNISTLAVAFLGIVLSYNFKQDKVIIRFLKFTLGLTVIVLICHFVKYLSILTLVFVYTGAFWAFSTNKIRINFEERKSLINEIEERKRLNNLKHDSEIIASKSDNNE